MLGITDLIRFSDIVVRTSDKATRTNWLDSLNLISIKLFNYQLEPNHVIRNLKTCEHYSKIILLADKNRVDRESIYKLVQSEEYRYLQYLFMYARGLKVEAILKQLKKIGRETLDWIFLV